MFPVLYSLFSGPVSDTDLSVSFGKLTVGLLLSPSEKTLCRALTLAGELHGCNIRLCEGEMWSWRIKIKVRLVEG